MTVPPDGWNANWSTYGDRFVGALQKGTCRRLPISSRAEQCVRGASFVRLAQRWEGLMLTSRIIPCLDVKAGRVVKGVRFQNLRDAGCPVEAAAQYALAGTDELVILDVSATRRAQNSH